MPPTEQDRATFDRDGFLVARGFFGLKEMVEIMRWTEEITKASEVPGRHMVYYEDSLAEPGKRVVQRIENFCPYHEGFDRLIRSGKLSDWVAALMGGPVVLFKEKINFKKPGGDGFKAHQDQQAGWSKYAPLFVTALVTIDPATIENGCLELAAGRHREGMVGQEWVPLSEDKLGLVAVPTEPGDVVFFDSFVPHASKANFTKNERRILYLTYNLAKYGDHRVQYFADKRQNFPPDIERDGTKTYVFRV